MREKRAIMRSDKWLNFKRIQYDNSIQQNEITVNFKSWSIDETNNVL